jgi:CRISPR-associated endonuclease/helicase Cas3
MDNTFFRAHIKCEEGPDHPKEIFQSVKDHCRNTAKYAEENGTGFEMSDTMYFIGLLHDIGKSTKEFDTYLERSFNKDTSVHRGEVNHSSAGARKILNEFQNDSPVGELLKEMAAYAVAAHHGIFDELNLSGDDKFSQRVFHPRKEIHYHEVQENCADWLNEKEICSLFSSATQELRDNLEKIKTVAAPSPAGYKNEILLFEIACLQRMILSSLVDADRRDTSEFMSGSNQKRLSQNELSALWKHYDTLLEEKISGFSGEGKINRLRQEMSQQCADFASHDDGIYRLSIPTGGGKTIASMRYALKLAVRTGKRHIIYTAPYLSILEQNARDYEEIFQDPQHILEHHSNVVFEENESGSADREDLQQWELLAEDWSAPMILTTMVRFLDVLFGGSMQDIRRMHALCDSIIILDEAQSIPVKMIDLVNTALNFLNRVCHCTIIICTATQPLFEKTRRPLLFSSPKDMIREPAKYERCFERASIVNAMIPGGYGTEDLAAFIQDHFENNMLVILNTKTAVRKLYGELQDQMPSDVKLIQLTTFMCAQHRLDQIEQMKKSIRNNEKLICVSTQLIEAGVDISFQTVIRSAAGLDNIAQAAGRCNRNGEFPNEVRNVYVINYREENLNKLRDIRLAQEAFNAVVDTYHGKYLSQEAMDLYYQRYYFSRMDEMSYQMTQFDINDSLYDLLSENRKARNEFETGKQRYPYPICQAYQTAYNAFQAIESTDQVGVIVPYGKGISLIEDLRNAYSLQAKKDILKQLQRYTVNLGRHSSLMKTLIERRGISDSELGGSVWILDPTFYDENGVDTELLFQNF